MSRLSKIIPIIIIFAFILGGCQAISTPSVTKTPQLIQATIAPIPSATSSSQKTHDILPTFTQEVTQIIPTLSSTPSSLQAKFPKACQDELSNDFTKISPDGDWLAESCFSNGTMQVSNQHGTKFFVVNSQDYVGDPNYPELIGSVRPVHWTVDTHFVYFTVTPEQWNDGGNLSLGSFSPSLYRMDINNGQISKILTGTFYHSFSPTDRRLIEVQEYKHPIKLIVHDLKTGLSEIIIPENNIKYSQVARVIWSPDGLKFVFVAAFGWEYGDEVNEPIIQALIVVDLGDLSQRIIISKIPDFIEPISWGENNMIVYKITNYEDRYKITTYAYDYQNQKIAILPTSAP